MKLKRIVKETRRFRGKLGGMEAELWGRENVTFVFKQISDQGDMVEHAILIQEV